MKQAIIVWASLGMGYYLGQLKKETVEWKFVPET